MRASDMLARLLPFTAPMVAAIHGRPVEGAVTIYAATAFTFVCSGRYTEAWVSLAVPFLGLAAITTASRTVRFGAVLGIAGMMAALVAANYYIIANHGFMLMWAGLGLALACACDAPRDEVVLRRNATLLLSILMGVALIQKLRSGYYMEGDLLGGLLLQGEIYFNLIAWVMPDWPGLVADYKAAAEELLKTPEAASVAIAVPPVVAALAWRMTVGSLVAQAALEAMILFRARMGMLLHLAILAFVVLVYSTRNENEFLSINCLLGYAMTDDKTAAARPWYVLAVIYLLATALIGVRPWIFS
jgi:hypothetical protein